MRGGSRLVVAALLAAGCGGAGGVGDPPPTAGPAAIAADTTHASAAPDSRPTPSTVGAMVPESCRVTVPTAPFTPPAPAPEEPPAHYDAAWYGSPALWTMLHREGETWPGLPLDPGGLGQKTFWWSALWDHTRDFRPAISVGGRRLDAPGEFATTGRGTNASADFGTAMLIGVTIPAAGCWELTGTYRDSSLSFVVWVPG